MITKIILKMFIRFDKTIISRPVKESAWVAVQSGYGICVPRRLVRGEELLLVPELPEWQFLCVYESKELSLPARICLSDEAGLGSCRNCRSCKFLCLHGVPGIIWTLFFRVYF